MPEHTLPKAYDFKATEQRIYQWWESRAISNRANDPNKPGFDPSIAPFVISIPPPNVTGELHLGHAMFVSMEDLMIRYHRMKGVPTLWVPGTDHAGIATQLQVEKMLREEGTVPRSRSGGKNFCAAPGNGRKSTAGSSPARSAAWGLLAIGSASASPWTQGFPRQCVKPSCACTKKA